MENKRLVELGRILRDCRTTMKVSLSASAKTLDIDKALLSRIETGKVKKLPSKELLTRMIRLFHSASVPDKMVRQIYPYVGLSLEQPDWSTTPPSHYSVVVINGLIGELPEQERESFGRDLIDLANLISGIKQAEEKGAIRDWKDVEKDLSELKNKLNRLSYLDYRVYYTEGRQLYSNGRYKLSREAYSHALSYLEKVKLAPQTPEEELKLLLKEADIYIRLGDCERRQAYLDQSITFYEVAEKIYRGIDSREGRIGISNCLRKKAAIQNYYGEPQKAKDLLDQAENTVTQEGDTGGLYKIWQHRAWSLRLLGKWEESIEYNQRALIFIQKNVNDERELSRAYDYLADSYRINHQHHDALEHYDKARKILTGLERQGQDVNLHLVKVLQGYGQVLQNMGRSKEARDVLLQCKQLAHALGEEFRVAQAENELGIIALDEEDDYRAKLMLEYSTETFRRLKALYHYYISLVDLCKVYLRLGKYNDLYLKVNEAEEADNSNVNVHMARLYLLKGRALLKEGKPGEVCLCLTIALEKAQEFNQKVFGEVTEAILAIADEQYKGGRVAVAKELYSVFEEYLQKNNIKVRGAMARYLDEFRLNQARIATIESPATD